MSVVFTNIPAERGLTENQNSDFYVGSDLAIPTPQLATLIGADGARGVSVSPAVPSVSSAEPLRSFGNIFYFRIWVVPTVLDAQNPIIGDPIAFRIWNAYLVSNEIQAINSTGATGLTLSATVGDVLDALEYRETTITIGSDAPIEVSALFSFDFALGEGDLTFLAILADIVPLLAESTITETYQWLTDELRSYDGTEARIAVRQRPRRTISFDVSIWKDADRKKLYDKIYKTVGATLIAPAYQFQVPLKQSTVISDNKIFCNPKRADLRAGENVVIIGPNEDFYLYTVDQVFSDHVTITTAFAAVIPKRSIVAGGFAARIPNNTSISMTTVSGKSSLRLDIVANRDSVAQPDTTVTLDTFNGYPVLNRRPLGDSEANEAFDLGLEVIDNDIAPVEVYRNWTQPYVNGLRRFLVQSLLDIEDMEWWRVFLDYCKGKQKPFLLSTYRQDLVQAEGTDLLILRIEVEGSDYAARYFQSPT